MKRILQGSLVFWLSLVVVFSVVAFDFSSIALAAKEQASLTLRWADMSPATGTRPKYLMKAAAEIEKATEGRVKIQFYWSNSLVKVKENVRAVQKGIADMAWAASTYHPAEYPMALASQNMLYAPKCDDAALLTRSHWEMLDEHKPYRDQFEKWGAALWYFFPYDSYGCYAKKPIKTLEDFKGMRLRVSSEGIGKTVSILGAHPLFLPASEVYTALEKNMIDGAICGYEWGKRYNLYEVTQYLNLLNSSMCGCGYGIVSKAALAKMSDADRKVFMEIGRRVSLEYGAAVRDERQDNIKIMEEKGMTLVPFSQEEKERWADIPEVKAMIPAWLEEEKKEGRGEESRGYMKLFLEKMGMSHLMPK